MNWGVDSSYRDTSVGSESGEGLGEQVEVLERKVEREQLMAGLPALDEALLSLAKEHGRLTVASAMKLTEAGRLRLRGAGRGAWYEVA